MSPNGLQSFSFHQFDDAGNSLKDIRGSVNPLDFRLESKKNISPETAAKQYLEGLFASQNEELKSFSKPTSPSGSVINFDPVKTEYLPLTGHKIVKFRQRLNKVSVYGSVANIELDDENNFVSVNSSLAPFLPDSSNATISADQAKSAAADRLKQPISEHIRPLLYYYFHREEWKLVFVLKDIEVLNKEEKTVIEKTHVHESPSIVNIIVDAHKGNVLEVNPAVVSLRKEDGGIDENGNNKKFFVFEKGSALVLIDEHLSVHTYHNNFQPYYSSTLPGQLVTKNGAVWSTAGVSAHVNACEVARFLKDILKRNSIDNEGMIIISSVDCVKYPGMKEWFNAVWLSSRKQMAYGQSNYNGRYKSLAASLDIVAHEIFHGVTHFTSNLEYHNQAGALNESFSDIFGIILSNYKNKDVNNWNWQLGEEISAVPLRNLQDPTLHDQPANMNDYQKLPDTEEGDWGGVHTNSGIHNKAAYLLLTAKEDNGSPQFTIDQIAQLYYYTLVQLAEKSGFSDSYRTMKNAAKSLFKNDPKQQQKLNTIDKSFNDVGIF